jgi:dCMP deaminase
LVTKQHKRPDVVQWALAGAVWASSRGECVRRRVGAVLLDDLNRVVGVGYNGAPAGEPSCLDGVCPRATSGVAPGSSYDTGPGSCIAIHAEANALLDAGRAARDTRLFVSTEPCDGCLRLARGARVRAVWWEGDAGEVISKLL